MKKITVCLSIVIACTILSQPIVCVAQTEPTLDRIGVTRGICVVLGDTKCELALKLARQSELLIYVQLPQAEDVEAARKAADAAGFYGTRIFVERGDLTLSLIHI